ncbi:MAG TPA: alpha/beta hydrolase [Alphaproteobacteria bacterium]|nr:alpha/beta hydrolase [Alphaproteobacteria bacterium]HAJ48475.1 alpha/beta hydrolase [Alphaproteobacteria bacterium]
MHITLNGQRIFFDVVGEKLRINGPRLVEQPTLIVMHGGPGFDHARMRPDFDHFADVAQVVYLDHRGNGRSQPSDPQTWNLGTWGDDVWAFCEALGIEKPIVFGQSFGGFVAQSYLTRHPEHPAGVIISSSAARMDFPATYAFFERKGGPQAREVAERFWANLSDQDFADYMRVCMPLYAERKPRDPDQGHRSITNLEVMRHFSRDGGEIKRMDFRQALMRAQGPVLVLGGSQDPITPPHLSEEIAAHLPQSIATLRIFDGCGHGAYRDDPDRVWPVMRDWMASL